MPGKATPRPWTRFDLAFLEQDTVRTLGETFGPGGPLVLVCLILETKRAAMAGGPVEEQGALSMRFSALARSAFVTEDEARRIIAALVELELLAMQEPSARSRSDLEESASRFKARLLKWSAWEPRDATGADRQRRYRERQHDVDGGDDGIGF